MRKVTRTAEKDGVTTVTISRLITGAPAASTFKTTATGVFEKDDYVVYTVGKDGDDNVIQTMALAKALTGEITATSDDYIRLDGDRYDYAKYKGFEDGSGNASLGDATIYLDTNGNVVYVGKVEESAPEYLYVLAAEEYMGTISIKAMFTDGTTEIVDINKTKTETNIGAIGSESALEDNLYKYELDGSKYILSDGVANSGDTSVTITRGSTKLTDNGTTYAVTS